MTKRKPILTGKPHDSYFKAVFQVPELADQLIRYALPPDILIELDLKTLALSEDSFVDENLKASLSDLVYTCRFNSDFQVRICLLVEHKSEKPGRAIYLQLLRYLLNILEKDEKSGEKEFSITIPIVFYHGKEFWQPGTLGKMFDCFPEEFQRFVPDFDFLVVNLQEKSDDEIRTLKDYMLLRSILLTMKHTWEDEFYRKHFQEIFIFVNENVRQEMILWLLIVTLEYIQKVSKIQRQELMELIEKLPPAYEQPIKSGWDMMMEEFMEKGMEKGMALGAEKATDNAIRKILIKFPNLTSQEVAEMFEVPVSRVETIQRDMVKH